MSIDLYGGFRRRVKRRKKVDITFEEALSSIRKIYRTMMRQGYTIHEVNQLTVEDLNMINQIPFEDDEEIEDVSPDEFFRNGGLI